ncbi:GNAT family N-acetyltransferase [Lacticaseibacillus camelliae]|uniref:Acetyltransferase n=1 Tax=Lacticaseibacillus camelliae DSM 22697 = JCM 13995 TaxID=1423730 RepID=A0A0R2FK96_9LACO|nr:GNAT family N-acetyltransferase [Lacticaseibacillus camelliae]KRN25052.1 acetyltransferase [Lacticaseibacillus camelliae DSM 22697 = JCM 13995]
MHIAAFESDPHTIAELVDLILFCQDGEAKLNITMAEQPDVFAIPTYYQVPGGGFWVAKDEAGHVAGCIGLLKLTATTAVLKKFFVYPQFRGRPVSLGWQLYQVMLQAARAKGFTRLVLDTPEAEHRSHQFYERQGFTRCRREDLGGDYAFPDRASRFYQLNLNQG